MSQHSPKLLGTVLDVAAQDVAASPDSRVSSADFALTSISDTSTILVVDDEQGLADSCVHYLSGESPLQQAALRTVAPTSAPAARQERAAYQVLTATNAERAIALVKRHYEQGLRIDVAFLNTGRHTGIDGLEMIKGLLEIDSELYCVVITQSQENSLESVARIFGDDRRDQWDYVSKPFTGTEIVQKASNLLAAATRRRDHARLEERLRKAIDRFESDSAERAQELSTANMQLHSKQTALQGALDKLVETNNRLQQEIQEKSQIARELQIAQKLEAVGQLAAGIAHEINTPTQYIGNNIHFLSEAFDDLQAVVAKFKQAACADVESRQDLLRAAEKEADEVDIDFLYEEIPDAFEAISEGISTISTIVGAMRNFAHPDSEIKELGDINRAIESTLTVAHYEYRYLATIDCQLGDIPLIPCQLGGLNQVFLNMIVNAAHAIADASRSVDTGWIKIRTTADADAGMLIITFEDNGCGMDQQTQERIFDPFFTTKEVGRGTGQGLAIARDIIVDKHGGQISTDSTVGKGTRFTISLPL